MEITQEGTRDIKRYPTHPTWHDQHRWRVGYHGVYRVLKQVYPYLIVKKQKAKLVIDHYDKKFFTKKFGKGRLRQMNDEDKVYHDLLDHVLHLLDHKLPVVMMVAASLMAIAQRLYKTNLSEEDYQRIMKVAYETNVKPYDISKGTLH